MFEKDSEKQTDENQVQSNNVERKPAVFGEAGRFVFDFVKVFVIAVAIIVPIRWFLFQPFVVTGDSMEPNFIDGDYLIIDEISYRFSDPKRGDVVVLRFPNDPSQFFIKRIVGLSGERIVIQNGIVTVVDQDGLERITLNEQYLPVQTQTYGNVDLLLSDDEYFVLGDNRLSSSDSRIWGPLKRENIIGRTLIRAFPVREFRVFSSPAYSIN